MVTIRIIKPTVCGGKHVEAGQIVEAGRLDASVLLQMGKAEPYASEPPQPENREKTVKPSKRGASKRNGDYRG